MTTKCLSRRNWPLQRLKRSTCGTITGVWGDEPNGVNEIFCVRVADFDRTALRVANLIPTRRSVAPNERNQRQLSRGDLLIEKSGGGDNQPVGCVVMFDHTIEAICSNFISRIRLASGMHSPFWKYVHAWIYETRQNIPSIKQTTGIQNLDLESYLDIQVQFPPYPEQISIARFLDEQTARIDALVAEKQRLLDLLAEKRKALVASAVTRGIDATATMRDSGVPWLGQVPKHWDVKRVKYLFRLIAEPAPENNDYELLSLYTDIGVKPRRELEDRGNKSSTTDNYWIVRPGDLIVNKLLAWMGAFGISEYEGVTSPAYDVLRPMDGVEPLFYHHLFRCGICEPEFRARSYGIMDMRLRLYFDRLGDMYVPLPPLSEQRAIVEYIARETEKLDKVRAATERTMALLKERRAALIAAAVTGQIDIGGAA